MKLPTTRDTNTPLSPRVAAHLGWVEKYLLPMVYAYLAYKRFGSIRSVYLAYHGYGAQHLLPSMSKGVYLADMIRQTLLFMLVSFTGLTLLLNRPPVSLPHKLKHVTVPLAMSYYVTFYGTVNSWPVWLRENLMPISWQYISAVVGFGFSIIGYSIAIWALVYLRRSFALFVSVREIIFKGPYRYVRHPIYLGYLLDFGGLLLATCSPGMFLLGAGFVALLVCRARMEEEKLNETSIAYQSYVDKTGFLIPRLRSR